MRKILTLLVLTIFVSLSCASVVSASSNTPIINRYSGNDRYETAVSIAKNGWSQSDYCILVSGENFPDALVSAPLAKKYNAPILLTASSSLTPVTKQALLDLKVANVIIIGGTGIIPETVDTELQSLGMTVTRFAGSDRYKTCIMVAQQIYKPTELFVCTSDDFSSALSIAPIAAMKQIPIILVSSDSLSQSVSDYITSNSANITKTYVIGSTDVISDNVANQFPNVERILGATKYDRNIAVNQKFNSDFSTNGICVCTGEGFADSLAGSAFASKISEPIIFVNSAPPDNTKSYYQQRLANANTVYVFGGTGVVSDSVVQGLNNSNIVVNSSTTSTSSVVTTPSQNTTTNMSDADFKNYLNQNFGTLTIDDQTVHFTYTMGADLFSSMVDKTIMGHIDENDIIVWLKWILNKKQSDIKPFFEKINQAIANNYPDKSYFGDITYQHRYSFYPDAYPVNEVSYSDGKWLVTHSIVTFGDLKVGGISNPEVDVQ